MKLHCINSSSCSRINFNTPSTEDCRRKAKGETERSCKLCCWYLCAPGVSSTKIADAVGISVSLPFFEVSPVERLEGVLFDSWSLCSICI